MTDGQTSCNAIVRAMHSINHAVKIKVLYERKRQVQSDTANLARAALRVLPPGEFNDTIPEPLDVYSQKFRDESILLLLLCFATTLDDSLPGRFATWTLRTFVLFDT